MDLPNASEARRIVEQGLYEKAQLQLTLISNAIIEAIKEGTTTISIENGIEPSVKHTLEGKGYKVNTSSARNETYTSISW